ncbi:uncharacterized protein B0I36DRAFT_368827 [Microdochium trichocladiopsis]|uniref:FAD-binding domain-containing protein n=1 Tax=Microdochium trichocladiopsis TaxID=1682393 RepID=A0A9P8XT38_9PEZI|nr:uncharacterized protein B0I36DRAFT_368827 [Microdochium trichocladiopsis]KAH7016260.1 hypothetical protein B0I36DRAFT_368827 [Microdochium trichocladiopsis]
MTIQQTTAQIAIIGGGPCGLTLARLLEQHGVTDYAVYERDASRAANRAGGSLDLRPGSGQRALEEAGLLDEFKRLARYEDTVFTICDTQAKEHLRLGEGRDAPEIDRLQLQEILLASVPEDKIRWGHALVDAQIGSDGRPVLTFGNGVKVSGFKLVVGTDGAWSKVRPLITPSKPAYTGRTYLETRIQPTNPLYESAESLMGRGSTTAIGDNHILISQKQGDASYRLYLGFQMPEHVLRQGGQYDLSDADKVEAARSMLLEDEHYGTWAESYKQLIRHATDFRGWSLYSLPAAGLAEGGEHGWKTISGVTLAGDAAHLTPPNGEGVNLAMTDALDLAGRINRWAGLSEGDRTQDALDAVVREYEATMLPRGLKSIGKGQMMTDIMFAESHEPFVKLLKSFIQMEEKETDVGR